MRYLIQTTETYRADTEAEAQGLITEAKEDNAYVLAKYSSEKKDVKAKGEIVESFFKVSLTKVFNDDIKEPIVTATVNYEVD